MNFQSSPHWSRVLRAADGIYGRHSVTSIFRFLQREGAEVGLQQPPTQGYKLLPGRFAAEQWEEIKKEILGFLRDDIVKVLDKAWAEYQEDRAGIIGTMQGVAGIKQPGQHPVTVQHQPGPQQQRIGF